MFCLIMWQIQIPQALSVNYLTTSIFNISLLGRHELRYFSSVKYLRQFVQHIQSPNTLQALKRYFLTDYPSQRLLGDKLPHLTKQSSMWYGDHSTMMPKLHNEIMKG